MSDSFKTQIGQVISDHFSGATVTLEGPISVRDYSEIFRAHIETTPPVTAAVKRCLISRTAIADEAAAKDQFLALESVNKAISGRNFRYRAPAPIFIDTTMASFGMSWVEGQSLTEKLHQAMVFVDGAQWFEDAGAWLGNFHQAGPLRSGIFNIEERIGAAADFLNFPLPDKAFAHGSSILSQNILAMKNLPVQFSWLHGDCKTDNFLIGKDAIFGIDMSLSYENAVEYDIAQFLNHLELLFSSPKYLHLSGMRTSIESAFWRGYSSTGPATSDTCLNWIRLWAALTLWRSMLNTRKRSISAWLLNRMFSKMTQRLAKKIAMSL